MLQRVSGPRSGFVRGSSSFVGCESWFVFAICPPHGKHEEEFEGDGRRCCAWLPRCGSRHLLRLASHPVPAGSGELAGAGAGALVWTRARLGKLGLEEGDSWSGYGEVEKKDGAVCHTGPCRGSGSDNGCGMGLRGGKFQALVAASVQ